MSYQSERDEFLTLMGSEGVNITTARTLLREASVLQRLAELACSSERADRDQVRCPARPDRLGVWPVGCLCRDYGSFESEGEPVCHGTIPRHMVQSARSEARIRAVCERQHLVPHFGGDPRGCILVVSVPSGRTNDWERRGIAVPSRGFTVAQMERICR